MFTEAVESLVVLALLFAVMFFGKSGKKTKDSDDIYSQT